MHTALMFGVQVTFFADYTFMYSNTPRYALDFAQKTWRNLNQHNQGLALCIVECSPYEKALLNCMPRFLANSFLGLNYIYIIQDWYICLNLIDLSKKSTFCLFKTEFKLTNKNLKNILNIHQRRLNLRIVLGKI